MQIHPVLFDVLESYPWSWWGTVAIMIAGLALVSYVAKKQHLFDRLWGTLVLWFLMIPILPGYLADIAWLGSSFILLAWREFVRRSPIRHKRAVWWLGVAALVSQWLPLLFFPAWSVWLVTLMLVTFTAMSALRVPITMVRSYGMGWALSGLLVIVVGPGLAVVSMLWLDTHAFQWYAIAVVMAQASDACQMLVGRMVGKHSLHRWSPSKTWEGLVGGIGLAMCFVLGAIHALGWMPVSWTLVGFLMAVGATGFAGGFLSSFAKRQRRIKHWGRSLGGHGGVLDRIDSLLLTLPFALCWTTLMQ
jgi:phosphatidate cytidylyltransferase